VYLSCPLTDCHLALATVAVQVSNYSNIYSRFLLGFIPEPVQLLRISGRRFLLTVCPSCLAKNGVTVLNETQWKQQGTNPHQWPGLILSLPTTGLVTERVLLHL